MIRLRGPSLPYDPTYHLLARPDKIRALVVRERPDVLEAHSPYLALLGVLACPRRAFGVRTFWWHSDFIDTYLHVMLTQRLGGRDELTGRALAPLWRTVRALLGGCDAVFVAGRDQAGKLRAHGVRDVVVIPFGVEKSIFHPGARSESRRREILAGRSGPLVVAVGRFAVEKRWDVLFDAFDRIATRLGGGVTFAVFGDGPERAALQKRAEGRDDLRFCGFERDRARLASALASADVLIHACPYETFGLSVAEAMSCGLPVVVPDRGGASESVDPSSSEVYAAGDAEACARGALELLGRDRDERTARAVSAASRVPSVEQHFDQVLAAYEALLRERRRPPAAAIG